MKPSHFTASALLALAAAATLSGPASAQAMSPEQYVAAAGASDLYERQSSQLVLRSTRDAKVRQFATMMLADHAKSTAQVNAAAARARVQAGPPQLDAQKAQMIAQLQAATGPARDAAYVSQQKAAHAQALTLHQDYAANGSSAPLKAVATAVVPVIQHHIDMLQTM
jgi:putative membrane protein